MPASQPHLLVEAAGNGTAVLYQRRDNWPEQEALIEWLQHHARCAEITADQLRTGQLADTLDHLLAHAVPPLPTFCGIDEAVTHLTALLGQT